MPWRQMRRLVELGDSIGSAEATWLLAWFDGLPVDVGCPRLTQLNSDKWDGDIPAFQRDALSAEWPFFGREGDLLATAILELGPGPDRLFWVGFASETEGWNAAPGGEDILTSRIEITPETTGRIVEVLRGVRLMCDDLERRQDEAALSGS